MKVDLLNNTVRTEDGKPVGIPTSKKQHGKVMAQSVITGKKPCEIYKEMIEKFLKKEFKNLREAHAHLKAYGSTHGNLKAYEIYKIVVEKYLEELEKEV